MSKPIPMIGKKFGSLVVLQQAPKDPNKKDRAYYYICKCDCGNITTVSGCNLRKGNTKSCGCLQKKVTSLIRTKDITNQRFGKLVAKKIVGTASNGHNIWLCNCDCGNTKEVIIDNLTRGLVHSCGCLKQSYATLYIEQLLRSKNIAFKKEYYIKNLNCYFDYYIENKYFLEFDGEQHFKYKTNIKTWNNKEQFNKTRKNDLLKNNYCFENNIPLIRIPYTHEKNIALEDLLLEQSNFIFTKEKENTYYGEKINNE